MLIKMETTFSPRYLIIQCMESVIEKQKIERIMTKYYIRIHMTKSFINMESTVSPTNLMTKCMESASQDTNMKLRLTPITGIQQKENETSFNSTYKKTAMKQMNKQLQ